MDPRFLEHLSRSLTEVKEQGLFKAERIITSPQQSLIKTRDSSHSVINLCANNYLGLANHPQVINAAHEALEKYGYGMSSVRFICGTQIIHQALEQALSHFLKTEDTLLYSSCFDANTGLFEAILGEEDAVLSDELNHASIIDGIRLCKAQRFRYAHNDMSDLERQLKAAHHTRFRLIATDGVFSMEGQFAKLPEICELAARYHALVMVDDSHAVGFIGPMGRGSHEYWQLIPQVDILTGTLGKALGGASGGYTSGRKEIIAWLRQRSRPYLFSNTLAPVIVATSLAILDLLQHSSQLRDKLFENTKKFRKALGGLGFQILAGDHPIIPLMLGDAKLATDMAEKLLKEDVYVISFSYPVVPKAQARIRIQISASHTTEQLEKALAAFEKVGKQMRIIP